MLACTHTHIRTDCLVRAEDMGWVVRPSQQQSWYTMLGELLGSPLTSSQVAAIAVLRLYNQTEIAEARPAPWLPHPCTFLAASRSSTAFSNCLCSMQKSEQRARRAGSDFSSRSSAMSCRAANCWVVKANSRALEKCPACGQWWKLSCCLRSQQFPQPVSLELHEGLCRSPAEAKHSPCDTA